MATRRVLQFGDETLNKKSRPVTQINRRLLQLIEDMEDTLRDENGVGLAAPQVGVLKRVVLVDTGEDHGVVALINPEIIAQEGEQNEIEGCLSCPGRYGITRRPMKVTVRAVGKDGKQHEYTGEGLVARAFCHEIDHLDGILFTSRAIRMLDPEELSKLDKGKEVLD